MQKKLILIFAGILSGILVGRAQSLEIIPQTNYTIGGKVYANFGELNIRDSESYGLSLNFVAPNNTSFQIEYFYQPTTVQYRDYFDPAQFSQSADLRINWVMMGARKRFEINERIVPFAGGSFGLTRFALDSSPNIYNEVALALALQGGLNVYVTKLIGLRFHARFMMPVQVRGFGFYASTGGAAVGASAGSYFVQADFGAGLVFRLNAQNE